MSRFYTSFPVFLILCIGCDQSFNPKTALDERLVVFSVLSNDRDVQFVRVSTNYDVPGFDPSQNRTEKDVVGAQVSIAVTSARSLAGTHSSHGQILAVTLLQSGPTLLLHFALSRAKDTI